MKDKINKFFVLICLIMLYLPILFLILGLKLEDSFSSKKINANFKKNFPLKEDYFSLYSDLKQNVFNTNPIPDKVFELKNGWLFMNDEFSDNYSESIAFKTFSKKELDTLALNLNSKSKWLKENGIDFYLAIARNKETVYANMIPVIKKNKNTKREQLDSLCKLNKVNFIDLGSLYPKKSKHNLYYKTDTHWNDYGAYYGYLSIIEKISQNHPEETFKIFNLDDFELVASNKKVGDLSRMLKRLESEASIDLEFKKNINLEAKLLKPILEIPKTYTGDPIFYENRYVTKQKNLKVLLLTDSFGDYLSLFLKENFKETVFIFSHFIDKEMIKREQPDIIIQEIVERNVDVLLDVKK